MRPFPHFLSYSIIPSTVISLYHNTTIVLLAMSRLWVWIKHLGRLFLAWESMAYPDPDELHVTDPGIIRRSADITRSHSLPRYPPDSDLRIVRTCGTISPRPGPLSTRSSPGDRHDQIWGKKIQRRVETDYGSLTSGIYFGSQLLSCSCSSVCVSNRQHVCQRVHLAGCNSCFPGHILICMHGPCCRCEFQVHTDLQIQGFDTGIATTSKHFHNLVTRVQYLTRSVAIAHQSWIDYMKHPSNGLTGAV